MNAFKHTWFSRKAVKQGGFTLVEAMVAISILAMSVTGPLLIAQKGIGSAIYARDQITAFYLAQEAVEYIRNVRDTNRIVGTSWLTNLDNCTGGKTCRIDGTILNPVGNAIDCSSDSGGVCKPLWLNNSTKLYGYVESGATQSPFTRQISITNSGDRSARIVVTISWSTKLFTPVRSFSIQEYIFNF